MTDDDPDAALLASVARGAPRAAAELVARKLPRLPASRPNSATSTN